LSDLIRRRTVLRLLRLSVTACLIATSASAQAKKRTPASQKTPLTHSSIARASRTSRFRRKYHAVRGHLRFSHRRKSRYYSASRHRMRAPFVQISPQRAEQIQQALIQAGDLHGTPTGQWDAQTREAMRQYQSANGFQPTGLPDAKSLMKLGLGPHPLPLDVDPLAQARPDASPFPPDSQQSQVAARRNQ
jgi:hypothetical protein